MQSLSQEDRKRFDEKLASLITECNSLRKEIAEHQSKQVSAEDFIGQIGQALRGRLAGAWRLIGYLYRQIASSYDELLPFIIVLGTAVAKKGGETFPDDFWNESLEVESLPDGICCKIHKIHDLAGQLAGDYEYCAKLMKKKFMKWSWRKFGNNHHLLFHASWILWSIARSKQNSKPNTAQEQMLNAIDEKFGLKEKYRDEIKQQTEKQEPGSIAKRRKIDEAWNKALGIDPRS